MVSGIVSLLLMLLFVGVWAWAWQPRHRRDFDAAARLALDDAAAADAVERADHREPRA